MKSRVVLYILIVFLGIACGEKAKTKDSSGNKNKVRPTYYTRSLGSMVRIITYDVYGQKISDGQGVYVAPDVIVTALSWFKGAYTAKIDTIGRFSFRHGHSRYFQTASQKLISPP
mgnify:CR=1 FL=1